MLGGLAGVSPVGSRMQLRGDQGSPGESLYRGAGERGSRGRDRQGSNHEGFAKQSKAPEFGLFAGGIREPSKAFQAGDRDDRFLI